MNEITKFDDSHAVLESNDQPSSMAMQLQRVEIDQQIATAHAFPRSLKRVQSAIMNMATLDKESADECIYALPRGGQPIKGPSVRFAEILKQAYGNCRAGARVIEVDRHEKFVEAEGVFNDLETNVITTKRVRRPIVDRHGRVYSNDMIIVTGNAACSIALRNAILDGVPKPLWRGAYQMVEKTIVGTNATLAERRTQAFKHLAAFGLKPDQILGALGVSGEEDITLDHILTMRGMFSALKNGEATVEEILGRNGKPALTAPKPPAPPQSPKENAPPAPAEPAAEPESKADEKPAPEAAVTPKPDLDYLAKTLADAKTNEALFEAWDKIEVLHEDGQIPKENYQQLENLCHERTKTLEQANG